MANFLDLTEIKALEAIRGLAMQRPVDVSVLEQRLTDPAQKQRHMQQMTEQSVTLARYGVMVTFSLEINHPGGVTSRHVSLSGPSERQLPGAIFAWEVAQVLGFTGTWETCDHVSLQPLKGHLSEAITLIQVLRAPIITISSTRPH